MNQAGKHWIAALLGSWWLLHSALAMAAVTASIDRSRITVEDTLTLTFKATAGEDLDALDLRRLERDFQLLGSPSRTTRYQSINGNSERSSELSLQLVPRRTGRLQIPSFNIAGQRTLTFDILVQASATNLDSRQDIFVESEVDAGSVFVQSQILHTFRIYEAINLQDRGRSELEIPDAVVEELDSNTFQRTIDGRTYRVIEVRHAIFPQKSGSLTIPAMTFTGRQQLARRNLMSLGGGEMVRRRAAPIEVTVKPIPANYPDAPWLPASKLILEEDWSKPPEQLQVGDSATRTISLVAAGIDGNQLPPVTQLSVDGIKVYPDQSVSQNSRSEEGISGVGINSAALLVTAAGDFTLPAIRRPWWDTSSNQLRYAEIPARKFSIAAPIVNPADAAVTPAGLASATDGTGDNTPAGGTTFIGYSIWLWTTVAACCGWLLTSILMGRRKVSVSRPQVATATIREPTALRELLAACEKNDAAESLSALQHWGRLHFQSESLSASDIANRLGDDDISSAISEMQESLFGKSPASWNGSALLGSLRHWRKQSQAAGEPTRPALPALYE